MFKRVNMSISVVELYRDILPKTNCGDCGKPSCMAFATVVVTEKFPIEECPHLEETRLSEIKNILEELEICGMEQLKL